LVPGARRASHHMPPAAVPKLSTTKKPSPEKKKKKAVKNVKADYGGVTFGGEAVSAADEQEEEPQDDPLATYRAAAAAAAAAVEKERKEEAQLALFRKIFAAMDSDNDGKVSMGEMIEVVAAGTAPLSHRASQTTMRPEGAVPLQLPMVFSLTDWEKEMKRVASTMSESTFEANVMGLFSCFTQAKEEYKEYTHAQGGNGAADAEKAKDAAADEIQLSARAYLQAKRAEAEEAAKAAAAGEIQLSARKFIEHMETEAKAKEEEKEKMKDQLAGEIQLTARAYLDNKRAQAREQALSAAADDIQMSARAYLEAKRAASGPVDRKVLLEELFGILPKDAGAFNVEPYLDHVTKMSGEGGQFGSLIHFLKTLQINAEGSHGRKFTFEAFFAATLAETPLGQLRDNAFASALRGMTADVRLANEAREAQPVDVS